MELIKMIPIKITTHNCVEFEAENITASEVYEALKDLVENRLSNCYKDLIYANRMQKVTAIDESNGITFVVGNTRHLFSFRAEQAMKKFLQTAPNSVESLYEFLAKFDKLVIIQLIKAITLATSTKLTYSQKEMVISICCELLA